MPPGRSTRIHCSPSASGSGSTANWPSPSLKNRGVRSVDQLEDAGPHQAPEIRRPELDDGLPARGHDHAALHETVGGVAAESRPVAPESLRPLLEKALGALEEPPRLRLRGHLDSWQGQRRVHASHLGNPKASTLSTLSLTRPGSGTWPTLRVRGRPESSTMEKTRSDRGPGLLRAADPTGTPRRSAKGRPGSRSERLDRTLGLRGPPQDGGRGGKPWRLQAPSIVPARRLDHPSDGSSWPSTAAITPSTRCGSPRASPPRSRDSSRS